MWSLFFFAGVKAWILPTVPGNGLKIERLLLFVYRCISAESVYHILLAADLVQRKNCSQSHRMLRTISSFLSTHKDTFYYYHYYSYYYYYYS